MASGVHAEFELTVEDGNLCDVSASENWSSDVTSAAPGRKPYKLFVVSFALLCFLPALLSISLRLALSDEPRFKNMTKEIEQLKRINFDVEARYKNLTAERDEVKRINSDLEASFKNVAEERDELKRINSDNRASFKNLTAERDELKRLNSDVEARNQNLIEEKDKLKRINSDIEASSEALTKERDELEGKLNISVSQHKSLTEKMDKMRSRLSTSGWMYFRDSLYYISSSGKNWQESRKDCLQKGADLIIINSQEEQEFTRQFKRYFWIGLTDTEAEGKWKWVDGTPLTRSFWNSREPNGKRSENCAQTKHPDLENNWNDESCSKAHYWICEEKLSP